jgi:hypothetical protein
MDREAFARRMVEKCGKMRTKQFLKAADKRFRDVLEYRVNEVVIVRECDAVRMYAFSGESGNWYQLGE